MNKLTAALLTICTFVFIASPSMAGEKKKDKGGDDVFTKYDENKNGTLDDDEKTKLRADFKAGDAALKKYDTNNDGTLDDNELAAIKPPEKKKKKNK